MRILIAALADFSMNPRPNRMVNCLKKYYDVTVMSYGNVSDERVPFIKIDKKKKIIQKIKKLYDIKLKKNTASVLINNASEIRQWLKAREFDLIICHNIELLPLISSGKKSAKIILDVREFYPRHFEDRIYWNFFYRNYYTHLCKHYLHQADYLLTVSKGLAEQYRSDYGLAMDIMYSLPYVEDCDVRPTKLETIKMIHHGNATPSRKIETMIKTMDCLDDRFHLDLMLVQGKPRYYQKLKKLAQKRKNVSIIPPVPFENIITWLNQYDIGFYLCPPTSFNTKHMMPNKLFEFIHARLAIAVGPSPDMSNFVRENGVGVVSDDFSPESMAKALNSLSVAEIDQYKKQSDKAAHIYNADVNEKKIMHIIEKLSTIVSSP